MHRNRQEQTETGKNGQKLTETNRNGQNLTKPNRKDGNGQKQTSFAEFIKGIAMFSKV